MSSAVYSKLKKLKEFAAITLSEVEALAPDTVQAVLAGLLARNGKRTCANMLSEWESARSQRMRAGAGADARRHAAFLDAAAKDCAMLLAGKPGGDLVGELTVVPVVKNAHYTVYKGLIYLFEQRTMTRRSVSRPSARPEVRPAWVAPTDDIDDTRAPTPAPTPAPAQALPPLRPLRPLPSAPAPAPAPASVLGESADLAYVSRRLVRAEARCAALSAALTERAAATGELVDVCMAALHSGVGGPTADALRRLLDLLRHALPSSAPLPPPLSPALPLIVDLQTACAAAADPLAEASAVIDVCEALGGVAGEASEAMRSAQLALASVLSASQAVLSATCNE